VAAWEQELSARRADARRDPLLPFARRVAPPAPAPKAEPVPHPKSTLPDLERRLTRERRRAGQKPQDHESSSNPERYSETPVHQRAASRKVRASRA
jgi:hypothetical protein